MVGKKDKTLIVKIQPDHTPNDVLREFLDQGVAITAFSEQLPSLNEIFIKLVEGSPATRQFQNIQA